MKAHAAGTGYALSFPKKVASPVACTTQVAFPWIVAGFQCEIFQHGISMGFNIINQLLSWDF